MAPPLRSESSLLDRAWASPARATSRRPAIPVSSSLDRTNGGAPSLRELFHPYRWVETRFGLLVLGALCLSAFDAGSTLYLMGTGLVEEANPFMRRLIEYDPRVFALWKQWMTGGALIVAACLARHPAFGFLEGRIVLRVAFTGYCILAGWHLFLISLTRIS
jgi:hypothetical protein